MWYVYVLSSRYHSARKLYVGYTHDLRRRLAEHNAGQTVATAPFAPWRLAYYEAYAVATDAQVRERQLKHHANAWSLLKRRIQRSLHEG